MTQRACYRWLRIVLIISPILTVKCDDDLSNATIECIDEESLFYAQSLSSLPISQLLTVKNTFDFGVVDSSNALWDSNVSNAQVESRNGDFEVDLDVDASPNAQALIGDKVDYMYEHEHVYAYGKKNKKDKLQKLFAITITALSFLAFAGYLLCLIVQAIKSKAEIYMVTTTIAPDVFFRRRRRRRRRRKPQMNIPRRGPRNRRQADNFDLNKNQSRDNTENISNLWIRNVKVDQLYDLLINFSEKYTEYNSLFG